MSSTPFDPTNVEANPQLGRRSIAARLGDPGIELAAISRAPRPDVTRLVLDQPPQSVEPPPASPTLIPPQPAVPPPVPTPPQAPPANPFADLTFPSPGDRIKAEDFRRLSQALRIVSDTYALAGAAFGYSFGQVKLALAAQQYEITRIVSVYGTELVNPGDASFDDRKVLAVAPVVLGERRVSVVLTEAAADTRRNMPDLTGLTYSQAQARLQSELGELIARGGPITVPELGGLTVAEATRRMSS